MHPDKLKNVLCLSDVDRYEYFVGKITDFEEVWGLRRKGGWATGTDDQGRRYIPFWPERELAEAGKLKEWSDCIPEAIALGAFRERWIPGMIKDGHWACIFPVLEGSSIVIEPELLREDIDEALEHYE